MSEGTKSGLQATQATGPSNYCSRARLDASSLFLFIPSEIIANSLPRGLVPLPVRGAPRNEHPLWLDLAHVKSGAGEATGMSQQAWWAHLGEASGMAWGFTAGILARSLLSMSGGFAPYFSPRQGNAWTNAAWQLLGGGVAGAQTGASLGTEWGRRISADMSSSLGSYRELMLGIPNVARSGGKRRYTFILGMRTDSAIALWGDQQLGCGFRKALCSLHGTPFGSYRATTRWGEPIVNAELCVESSSWCEVESVSKSAAAEYMALPLLGAIGPNSYAVSHLERLYSDPTTRWAPTSGKLEITGRNLPVVSAGTHEIIPLTEHDPWGAFSVRNAETRLTFPERRQLQQL